MAFAEMYLLGSFIEDIVNSNGNRKYQHIIQVVIKFCINVRFRRVRCKTHTFIVHCAYLCFITLQTTGTKNVFVLHSPFPPYSPVRLAVLLNVA